MAIIACARRKSDGLLTWAQTSPQSPDQSAIIQNGIDAFGGVADDWGYAELSPQQYATMQAAMPGRSYLVESELTSQSAPGIAIDKDCQDTAESALPIYGSSALERNGSSTPVGGTG